MLRRGQDSLSPSETRSVARWSQLAVDGRVILPGIVRQELLRKIKHAAQFNRLRHDLDGFISPAATIADHDRAAECFNACGSSGVAAGEIDMLICAMAIRLKSPIFTTDKDFERYEKFVPIRIFNQAE